MSQKGLRHMVRPAPPRARLVVIHPQLTLGLFERGLDRPAQAAHAHQGGARTRRRRIGEEEFARVRLPQTAAQDEPAREARAAAARTGHPYEGKVRFDWSFAALFDCVAPPGTSGQPGGDLAIPVKVC
jgi:hypothetical protein